MYVAILGRQPAIGMAELEQLYGSDNVRWFSDSSALIDTDSLATSYLGGAQKAGRVILEIRGDWRNVSMRIVKHYINAWSERKSRLTLGISTYGFDVSPREVQKTGLILKSKLKTSGLSLRLVPNAEPALNTAASHHNKLGLSDNHIELLIVKAPGGQVIVAESVGAQNITALAARDQARPRTDAFVGMLPPKLARIMLHLTGQQPSKSLVLDPFCGTGVVLQEALLDGYDVLGTDLSDKMVDYTKENLTWLQQHFKTFGKIVDIRQDDATTAVWPEAGKLDAVVAETYLGQPFSAPPSPSKLAEVVGNCNHIVSESLKNLAGQLNPGTRLCLAIPAWSDHSNNFTHLPLINHLEKLGYKRINLKNVRNEQLLYYRDGQVVARELLILHKI